MHRLDAHTATVPSLLRYLKESASVFPGLSLRTGTPSGSTAFRVDAQDQPLQSGRAQAAQLLFEIARGPEADDLEPGVFVWVAPVRECEVREGERAFGGHRARLAHDVPVGCGAREVACEAPFDLAIETLRRIRREDRIARAHANDRLLLTMQQALRPQLEAVTVDEPRNEGGERSAVHPGATEDRERSRELETELGVVWLAANDAQQPA